MPEIPESLTDEGMERTITLGREMMVFVTRRSKAKAVDPKAKVEPHPELLALIDAIKAEDAARYQQDKDRGPNV